MNDLVLPFKILISPLKTFSQLSQSPSVKGLISLSVLVVVTIAASLYASAMRIDLNINSQPTSLAVTNGFSSWFVNNLAISLFYVVMYWLVFASGLALLSRTFGGKQVSLRVVFLGFAYVLPVFIVLYAVRALIYLALPSIPFGISYWPPVGETDVNAATKLMTDTWGPFLAYQFGTYFTFVAFVWLIALGAIAVKALRELSWGRALMVSAVAFFIALFLFGPF